MKHRRHLSPNQNLLRLIYIKSASVAKPLGEFATWLLTGTAVTLSALLVNIEAVSKKLTSENLCWGLGFFVISLLAGVITRQLSLVISAGLELQEEMYNELETSEGTNALHSMINSLDQFKEEFISAYLPPLRWIMKRSFEKGFQDVLSGEKRLTKLISIQLNFFWTQCLFGTLGLFMLVFALCNQNV